MKRLIRKLTAVLLSLSIISTAFSVAVHNGTDLLFFEANAEESGEYTYTVENGEATITGNDGTLSGDIVIPDVLGGYPVAYIESGAFTFCESITGAVIPDSVREIREAAFGGCKNLKTITFGNNLEYIGDCAFAICNSLSTIHITEKVNYISDDAFKYCLNLSEITVAEENPFWFIENGALCSESEVLILPPKSGTTEFDVGNRLIRRCAFEYCENLEYIYIGKDADLGEGEWVGTCPSLKGYIVDEANPDCSSDENGALYNKDKTWLTSWPAKSDAEDIVIPDTVEEMYLLAFSGKYDAVLHINEALSAFFYENIDNILLYSAFKGFEVSADDCNFSVENSVLYSADKRNLIKYPISNNRSFFEVPEEVQSVYPNAFISLDLSGNPISEESVVFDVEDYNRFFLRPESLTVHVKYLWVVSSNYIEMLTIGLLGVQKVCTDIVENTDEESLPDYLDVFNNEVKTYAGSSPLNVPDEALRSTVFEIIQCEAQETPEEPDTPTDPDTPVEPRVLYIEFETYPLKSDYVVGEPVNVDGTVLRVFYDNGDVEYVSEGFIYSPSSFNKVGNNAITVYYKGESVISETYVSLGPPKSISVNAMPFKTEYYIGESFNSSGLTVTAEYADGSTEIISNGFTFYYDEFDETGTYTVTVEYEGCQATFDVTVVYVKPYCIYVLNYPEKLQYNAGETLDITGLEIELVYELEYPHSYSRTISEGFEVVCDLSTPGTKTAVVTYTESGITLTTEFTVEVSASAETANIFAADIAVISGETVSIPVNISNNSGFMGFSVILEYDDTVLTPVCVTAGDILGSGSLSDSIGGTMPDGKLKVTYYSDENVSSDGTLFYVNFAAAENSVGDYTVNISYVQKDTFDENFENVILNCKSFTVSFIIPDDGKVRFYSDSATVDAGGELSVPVYASNAGGLTDFTLTLTYNSSILRFKKIQSDYVDEVTDNGNGTLTLKCTDTSVNTDTALVFNAVFEVAEYIEAQETVKISCDSAVINNSAVEAICSDAEITVINPFADSPAFIYTDAMMPITNGFIDIPVYVNNNHGIMGFGMNFSYDYSVVEPVSVIKGNVISSGRFDDNAGMKQGAFKVVWSNTENVSDNGLLFTVRFRVLDNQSIKNVPVKISYSQPDTFNEKWEDVVLDIRIDAIRTPENSPKAVMVYRRTVIVGNTLRLIPSCNFEVTEKVWVSSNPDVATVDNHGNVTAVSKGECFISVKCCGKDSLGNEIYATAKTKITVNEKSEPKTFKELFREAFDNFFKVTLYDFAENFRSFIRLLFKTAY